ncbi:protein kinase domain-containing protein [Halofilum ochraceum]|uniref:protein kinase domain-containing protein n=1 Tax=Halofilum ochraceum TaxID=1611323 RepID=UPI0008DA8C11|nr:protein kinase [Halofilum ochraceum]
MPPSFERGDLIGRYEVVALLGEGAMSRVYRAHDPDIGRTVAIKVLRDELLADSAYVARFLREARSAGALVHPNIVTVFDVGEVDGTPYIAMECVEGEPLSRRLRSGRRFSSREAVSIAQQIADALDFAHRNGVVHRDIKPSNVLFTADAGRVKLVDFGIAHIDATDDAERTRTGAIIGTPRYMSPEQAAGGEVGPRSDLFSLGVILYEMLGGKCPFDARNTTALLLQITTKDPQPIRKLAPETPVGTARIVGRLLNKEPGRRFQSGAHLAAALTKEYDALAEHEVERRRNRRIPLKVQWAGGMGLILTVVMVVTALSVYHLQREEISRVILDSGSSLARYVAFDVATPLLSEDWTTLQAIVEDANRRETFHYLIVSDRSGIVRAATDPSRVGAPLALPGEVREARSVSGTEVARVTLPDGESALNFSAPSRFQDQRVGMVHLGLPRSGLDSVMARTRWLLAAQAAITITSVIGLLYLFGSLIGRPIERVRRAMADLAAGDTATRISVTRRDEFGVLYRAFNEMAERVERDPDGTLWSYPGAGGSEDDRTPRPGGVERTDDGGARGIDDTDDDDATTVVNEPDRGRD